MEFHRVPEEFTPPPEEYRVPAEPVDRPEEEFSPRSAARKSRSDVVPGKIAPAVTAVAKIELDLTGTEVAVDFKAEVGDLTPTNLPSSDKISLTSAVDGGTPGAFQTIPLVNESAFTAANGKKVVTLTLTWANDDQNNADDTETGIAGGTITVPVTMTVQQHIGA